MIQLIPFDEMMSAEAFTCANLLMFVERGVTGTLCHIWKVLKKKLVFSHQTKNFKVEYWKRDEAVMGVDLIISCAVKLPV